MVDELAADYEDLEKQEKVTFKKAEKKETAEEKSKKDITFEDLTTDEEDYNMDDDSPPFTREEAEAEAAKEDTGEEMEAEETGEEIEEKIEAADKEIGETLEEAEKESAVDDVIAAIGEDTILKIKGKEYRVGDLPKDEVAGYMQKGLRFYQRMEELAAKEKDLTKKEEILNRGAETVQRLMANQGVAPQEAVSVPTELEADEMDSDEVKALKKISQTLFKKVDKLEKNYEQTSYQSEWNRLEGEITSLTPDYPLASKEEVIAIKANYPNATTREIMEKSHNYYSSDEYFDKVLAARPEKKRELSEKAESEYLARKQKTTGTKVARKQSASAGTGKVTGDIKQKRPRNFEEAYNATLKDLKGRGEVEDFD